MTSGTLPGSAGVGRVALTIGALILAAGDYHHHVGCNVWNGRSAPAEGRGLAWFEVVVPGDAIRAVRERCETADLAVDGIPDGSGTDGFAVTDSDGPELRVRPAGE
jgi:catechol 2,3-dioxygenase